MRIPVAGIALLLCLHTPSIAAMDAIKNPADRIRNPADRMYNPATDVKNPADTMYNPATQIDNPNPLTPPVQPPPPPTVIAKPAELSPLKPVIPQKSYYLKTVRAYLNAAKKAFVLDDYIEFISVTEDALRRIDAGTLKASKKSKQKLVKFKTFGYSLLEKSAE